MSLARNLLLTLVSLPFASSGATLLYSTYDAGRSQLTSFNLNNNEQTETMGVMLIQVDGGAWQAAFCSDVFAGISQNTTYDSTGTPTSAAPFGRVAWLMANILPNITGGSPSAGAQAAALQLAIWDVIHDNGDGLQAGAVQQSVNTSVDVVNNFNSYLGAPWSPAVGLIRYQNTFQGTNISAQELVTFVPEPSTFGLGLLSLAGLAVWRRRG
jgi:MYXO-CTERM domain-containing protein